MAISITTGSESVTATEHYLFADSTTPSYQTTDAWVQVELDLVNLVAGDEFLFRIYERVDGTNARVICEATLGGTNKPWRSPAFLLSNGYEVSLDKISATDRTITWSLCTAPPSSITVVNDSASISTTEYGLFSDSTTIAYQTTDGVMQTFVDLSNMAVGDEYVVRVYEKVDGTNARVVYSKTLKGTQSKAWVCPARFVGNGYEVTVQRTAGADRTILWSTRLAS